MNSKLKMAMAASAIAFLVGCEANGGFPDGGTTPPAGDGGGDPGFIDPLGTLTLLPGWTVTQRASGTAEEIQSGAVCDLETIVLGSLLGGEGLCYVNNAEVNVDTVPPVNVVDQNENTYSVVNLAASLLDDPFGVVPPYEDPTGEGEGNSLIASGGVGIDLSSTVSAGNVAAFDIEIPPELVDANVLRDAMIRTYLNGEPQEVFDGLQLIGLDLLGLDLMSFVGDTRFLVGCVNTLPYNRIEIEAGGVVSASALDMNGNLPTGTDTLLDFVSGEALYIYDVVTGAAPPEGVDAADESLQCSPA